MVRVDHVPHRIPVPRSEIITDPDLQRAREEAKAKQIEIDERDLLRPLKAKYCPIQVCGEICSKQPGYAQEIWSRESRAGISHRCLDCGLPIAGQDLVTETIPSGGHGRPILVCDLCAESGRWDDSTTDQWIDWPATCGSALSS